MPNDAPLLIPSTTRRDGGRLIGRDPRSLAAEDYAAAGLAVRPPMRAIRAFCLACAGASPAEVRKCAAVRCPLWPLRMGRWVGRVRAKRSAAVQPRSSAPDASGLDDRR